MQTSKTILKESLIKKHQINTNSDGGNKYL